MQCERPPQAANQSRSELNIAVTASESETQSRIATEIH